MKLDDLYFGVVLPPISYPSLDKRMDLKTYNLFDTSKVKWSVAYWVASDDWFKKTHDFLSWCFGDVRGRTEYEVIICPWPYRDDDTIENSGVKMDTYSLYCVPNEKLLRQMVDSVTVSSAKKYLSEVRKRRK